MRKKKDSSICSVRKKRLIKIIENKWELTRLDSTPVPVLFKLVAKTYLFWQRLTNSAFLWDASRRCFFGRGGAAPAYFNNQVLATDTHVGFQKTIPTPLPSRIGLAKAFCALPDTVMTETTLLESKIDSAPARIKAPCNSDSKTEHANLYIVTEPDNKCQFIDTKLTTQSAGLQKRLKV